MTPMRCLFKFKRQLTNKQLNIFNHFININTNSTQFCILISYACQHSFLASLRWLSFNLKKKNDIVLSSMCKHWFKFNEKHRAGWNWRWQILNFSNRRLCNDCLLFKITIQFYHNILSCKVRSKNDSSYS